jgi:hypothetical protein
MLKEELLEKDEIMDADGEDKRVRYAVLAHACIAYSQLEGVLPTSST